MKIIFTLLAALFIQDTQAASYSCKADCNYSCIDILFAERNPDEFTEERCRNMGGRYGGIRNGAWRCVNHITGTWESYGSGSTITDAKYEAKWHCLRNAPSHCDESYVRSASNYRCN